MSPRKTWEDLTQEVVGLVADEVRSSGIADPDDQVIKDVIRRSVQVMDCLADDHHRFFYRGT